EWFIGSHLSQPLQLFNELVAQRLYDVCRRRHLREIDLRRPQGGRRDASANLGNEVSSDLVRIKNAVDSLLVVALRRVHQQSQRISGAALIMSPPEKTACCKSAHD